MSRRALVATGKAVSPASDPRRSTRATSRAEKSRIWRATRSAISCARASRPYAALERPAAWRVALDLLLLPVRLLYAVFQYLSFFTARYTGRPLTTAGGPKRRGADARRMQVWSNLIEAGESAEDEEAPPPTPRSWQLVRRRPDGHSETVADSVLSYDVDAEGRVVFTTGSAIHLVNADGTRVRLLAQGGIQQVAFAG